MSTTVSTHAGATITVGGMHCGHCASSVTKGLRTVPGVREVSVDVPTGRVQVSTDYPIAVSELERAVVDAGFDVVPPLSA